VKRVIPIVVTVLCCACSAPTSKPAPQAVKSPSRIVSLKPNITEILFALGAGDQVVGVTTWCHYPEAAKSLPKVGDYLRPFPEQVVAAAPDLIIGSEENSAKDATLHLRTLGLRTELFSFRTLDETYRSIQGIGDLIGRSREAAQVVQTMQHTLSKVSVQNPLRTLIVVGHRPLIVAGSDTFLSEVLARAGYLNVLGKTSTPYPHLNTEVLLQLNPDVIVDLIMGTEQSFDFWTAFPGLTAVKNGRMIALDMDHFHAAPRLTETIATLAQQRP
jgi:iron complex transport system substrate-binding protein